MSQIAHRLTVGFSSEDWQLVELARISQTRWHELDPEIDGRFLAAGVMRQMFLNHCKLVIDHVQDLEMKNE